MEQRHRGIKMRPSTLTDQVQFTSRFQTLASKEETRNQRFDEPKTSKWRERERERWKSPFRSDRFLTAVSGMFRNVALVCSPFQGGNTTQRQNLALENTTAASTTLQQIQREPSVSCRLFCFNVLRGFSSFQLAGWKEQKKEWNKRETR